MIPKLFALKMCPFCGGEPSLSTGQIGAARAVAFYIECIDCASSSDMRYQPDKAAELWNKRI